MSVYDIVNLMWSKRDPLDVESLDDIEATITDFIRGIEINVNHDKLMDLIGFTENELRYDYLDGALKVARKLYLIKVISIAMILPSACCDYI